VNMSLPAGLHPCLLDANTTSMNLQCKAELASTYKAGSQIARVLSEDWCTRELYCPACDSDCLVATKTNNPAVDHVCPRCEQSFQLKSLKGWNPRKIVDAGYEAMLRAIRADKAPNLFVMQYSSSWAVQNLVLIPRVFFTESIVEKRSPLGPQARRAGWVGCNILLGQIPKDGRIPIVSDGCEVPEPRVRADFSRIRGLAELPPSLRGWTVDVLGVIRRLGEAAFSLQELYALEPELQALHPRNQNVRPKIRQQLQVLRDLGLLDFSGSGHYVLRG
jgi:type II restriction enzyme